MSEREQLQNEIAEWLMSQSKFNAPYGVLTGMQKLGRGFARTITFGIARTLDATIHIYSPADIRVTARGPACTKYAGNFKSLAELQKQYEES